MAYSRRTRGNSNANNNRRDWRHEASPSGQACLTSSGTGSYDVSRYGSGGVSSSKSKPLTAKIGNQKLMAPGGHISSKTTQSTHRGGAVVLPSRLKVTPKPSKSSKSSGSSMPTSRSGTLSPTSFYQSSTQARGLSASKSRGLSTSVSSGLNSRGSPTSVAGSGGYSVRPPSPSLQRPRKPKSYDSSTPTSEFGAHPAPPSYSRRYSMTSSDSLNSISPPGTGALSLSPAHQYPRKPKSVSGGSNIPSSPPPYQYPEILSGSSTSRCNSSSISKPTSGSSVAPLSPSHKLSRRSSSPVISSGFFEEYLGVPKAAVLRQVDHNHESLASARESIVHPPSPSHPSPRRSRRLSASSGTSALSPPLTNQDPRESLSDSMYEALSISPTSASSSTATSRVRLLLKKFRAYKKMAIQGSKDCAVEQMFVEGGLIGLTNIGNTCYMNSMLQCLSHTLEMTQAFLHPDFHNDKPLVRAYSQLMKDLWKSGPPLSAGANRYSSGGSLHKNYVTPTAFKRALAKEYPQYSGVEQQDAQEFMRFLVSGLHDRTKMEVRKSKQNPGLELRRDKSASHKEQTDKAWQMYQTLEDSFISEVFMGQLKSTLQCSVCRGDSVTFDPFWDVCLPIPRTSSSSHIVSLSDCFKQFSQEDVLDGDDKPMCASCRKCQRSIKRMTIQRFPPILVLMLKRFSGYQYRSKLTTVVGVPQKIDLSAFASDDAKDQSTTYQLYATSNHSGFASFGHYTAWVKHYATDQWYEFNDMRVTKLTSTHPVAKSTVYSSEPYVLFYRRASSADC